MAKTKMTAFSRMLLFLIIFLPLSFFGASFINGENPMDKIREFLGNDAPERTETRIESNSASGNADLARLENQILRLEKDLAVANEKLARCQLEQQQNQ